MKSKDALRLFFTAYTNNVPVVRGAEFLSRVIFYLIVILLSKGVLNEKDVDRLIEFCR